MKLRAIAYVLILQPLLCAGEQPTGECPPRRLLSENEAVRSIESSTPEKRIKTIREFKDDIKRLTSSKNYYTCNFALIDSVVKRDKQRKSIADPLKKPFKACPQIKYSCCSRTEMDALFKTFQKNATAVKYKLDLLYDTFVKYSEMRETVSSQLADMTQADEICAERTQKELFDDFNDVIRIAVFKKYAIRRYINYFIETQSGFVCSLCDGESHQYMYIDDKPSYIMNANQCLEFFIERFSWLEIELGAIRLANVVKALQCKQQQVFSEVFNLNNGYFAHKLSKINECYTNNSIEHLEATPKCHRLCRNVFTMNKYNDSNKYMTMVHGARDYYFKIILINDFDRTFVPLRYDKERVKILPKLDSKSFALDDYNIIISMSKGLYPHKMRMPITIKNSDVGKMKATAAIAGMVAAMTVAWGCLL